jgi:hypothetical protein
MTQTDRLTMPSDLQQPKKKKEEKEDVVKLNTIATTSRVD